MAVRSVDELLQLLQIDPATLKSGRLHSNFPVRVPRGFVARMTPGDPRDPLLLQVLPLATEDRVIAGFTQDPLHEQQAMPVPGLLHKYRGRALLTMTGACAIHCRYCFRRHFPYAEANPSVAHWGPALSYLAATPDISELILSGGDPLTLTDDRLRSLTRKLAAIPHLQTLRIHTRLPVVLPERIDAGLLDWISEQTLKIVVVIHCNHPNEIDQTVCVALDKLGMAGVTLLNQSVLLRTVNDDVPVLAQLSKRLFTAGVMPYYLHQMDRVQGAAHFMVAADDARRLVSELGAILPGYLLPRLVEEIPGMPGKTPL